MKSGLIVLALSFAFAGSLVAASELAEGTETETYSEGVYAITYRTSSGTHFLLSESSKTAYPNLDLDIVGSGSATVVLDGETSSVSLSSGINRISYSFDTGTEHILSVTVGSVIKNYSFKISKSISISELDPDSAEYITLEESELNNQKIIAALTAFLSSCAGVFVAFKIARWRAANGVETL